ncbi:MAG: PEP-CTERM sorting domain-containing protein [Candidatus Brocadiae bacterium]|nr:PEP-CTERM sorting domain-containing protein [Candidatus Brocadiia bacterium]
MLFLFVRQSIVGAEGVGLFDGIDLFIAYGAHDGNDVTLFTGSEPQMAVPEPATLSLLGLGGFALLRRRRRS